MGRNFTPEVLQALDAPFRNGLAPRGGLAFDGTASTRVYSTLTNQNVGTDAVSLVATFRVPTTAPGDTEVLSISASALGTQLGSSFSISLYSSGAIGILAVNAGATASRSYTVAGFISAYAGKVVTVTAARSANTVSLYINGVAQTGTDTGSGTGVNWSDSITSTYLIAGFRSSSTLYAGTIYSASLYNLALSPADVTEIYEGGGAVPERFKFGTQVPAYSSGFSADTDGWVNGGNVTTVTGNIDSIGGRDDNLRASGARPTVQRNGTIAARAGKAFRWSGSIYRPAAVGGTSVDLIDSDNSALANTGTLTADAWTDFSTTGLLKTGPGSGNMVMLSSAGSSPAADLYFRAIKFYQVGAVVHLPLNDNAGLIAYDSSTNALNATITATGVTWVLPPSKVVQVVDGTAALPSISFAADTDTGFYRRSDNAIGFAIGGVAQGYMATSGSAWRIANGISSGTRLDLFDSGAISLVAGSATNSNITLTPSGTGFVDIVGGNDASFANALRVLTPTLSNNNSALILLGKASAANQSAFINYFYSSTAALGRLDFGHNGTTGQVSLLQTGRFLIGTGGADSGALLQIGTNTTTSAGGMVFGTDTFLFRGGPNSLCSNASAGTGNTFEIYVGGVLNSSIGSNGTNTYVYSRVAGSSLYLGGSTTTALTLDASQNATFAASTYLPTTGGYFWTGRGGIKSSADGILLLQNGALTDFTRLQFGGTTNAFPALARSGTNLLVVDATGGSYTPILASNFWATGSAVTVSAGNVSYGGSTSTTVGAAGGASALPATPTGYIIINVAGTPAKLPYYAA